MKSLQLAIILVAMCIMSTSTATKLEEKFSWKSIEYNWPTSFAAEEAMRSEHYIPENNLPLGLDVWKDKLFITVPRFKPGVASTLNYVNISSEELSPILIPYPNWEFNTIDINPDGTLEEYLPILSAIRVRVDECDRLWVIDAGFTEYIKNRSKFPTLYIFDLNTDVLLRRYPFPRSYLKDDNYFINVIVDIPKNDCDNAFAYVPDMHTYSVVVYSYKNDESWHVHHDYFHFDPLYTDYNIGGVNYQARTGVFDMALGKSNKMGVRTVYFHAISSSREFSVPNTILQNKTRALSVESFHDYTYVGDRGPNGQASAEFLDEKSNVLFYTQLQKDAIYCWNVDKPYNWNTQGIVDMDSDSLSYPNDLKVDQNGNLWVLSDCLHLFLENRLNPDEFNFRILNGRVNELIAGTTCENELSQRSIGGTKNRQYGHGVVRN